MQWEYFVASLPGEIVKDALRDTARRNYPAEPITDWMNGLGQDGWELVGVGPKVAGYLGAGTGRTDTELFAFFKRPKP